MCVCVFNFLDLPINIPDSPQYNRCESHLRCKGNGDRQWRPDAFSALLGVLGSQTQMPVMPAINLGGLGK